MAKTPDCCIRSETPRPCAICGKMTNYVEYCVESPLCSDECIKEFYDELYRKGDLE